MIGCIVTAARIMDLKLSTAQLVAVKLNRFFFLISYAFTFYILICRFFLIFISYTFTFYILISLYIYYYNRTNMV